MTSIALLKNLQLQQQQQDSQDNQHQQKESSIINKESISTINSSTLSSPVRTSVIIEETECSFVSTQSKRSSLSSVTLAENLAISDSDNCNNISKEQMQQQQQQEQSEEHQEQEIMFGTTTIMTPPRVGNTTNGCISKIPPATSLTSISMYNCNSNINNNNMIITTLAGSINGGAEDDGIKLNIEDILRENMMLREKLKEISTDRDRLLCEVANLRLELDMAELKRLPEESFPQKVIDRSGPGQYALPAPAGSISSTASSIGGGGGVTGIGNIGVGGYVYLQQQQHYIPPPVQQQQQQQQIIYHQQHQMCHQPAVVHHHLHHGHHHGGAVVIAGSGVGTGVGIGGVIIGNGNTSSATTMQTLHKKNSVRNSSDVLKRSRAQTAYELSQDLLEKQIELLERKYGGLRARNAAITIQRAFRHYMMVKKFASITAMAKAEKRLSRRMMMAAAAASAASTSINEDIGPMSNNSSSTSAYGSGLESQTDSNSGHSQQQPRVCATITAASPGCHSASSRIPPTRSMSLRERRQLDSSPLPRSQTGATSSPMPAVSSSSWSQSSTLSGSSSITSHPHVNLLHATEQHYYSTPTQNQQQTQYLYQGPGYHSVPHDASFGSNNSNLDSSINSSWNSPHTPYYTAAQIYMRPRTSVTPTPSSSSNKKVPPEVPKRTSSITTQQQQQQQQLRQTPPPPSMLRSNSLCKTSENGSLTSVQSSGSDSSAASAERIANCDLSSDRSNSPHTWKRGTPLNSSNQYAQSPDHIGMIPSHHPATTVAAPMVGDDCMSSHTSAAQYEQHEQNEQLSAATTTPQNFKVSETIRKRQYRVGLNLFNKKPEKGITYLIRRGFLDNSPQGVARFLISRKGLSRQMIGEYLGNLQNSFNMAVLECFAGELDLSGMQVDVALRKFQAYFRMPGEAQKIERLMEIFSQRYCQCNSDIVSRLRSSDTVFVLAFAIIMLNTDLHTPNLKPERRMRVDDFIKNLRGIDDCHDIERDMLAGIYERVKANEFKPGSDHVTQVMKVQATIVGKKPNLALPHRRLVCYCRLYEIPDINKKERPGVHQREVFLFNDLLVITKIFSKKKSSVTYTFRNSYPLCGMVVSLLDVTNYPFCIRLSQKVDGKVLVTFNARNEHDRFKFAEDLRESISEMDEMETLRIEAELDRQKSARGNRATTGSENRDSGVADVEVCPCPFQSPQNGEGSAIAGHDPAQLKRSALSNSLLDMHEQFGNEKPQRRGSVGSLDSGMSISFQSTTASSASRENAAAVVAAAAANIAAVKIRFPPPVSSGIGGVSQHSHHPGGMMQHHHQSHLSGTAATGMSIQQKQMGNNSINISGSGRLQRERKHSRTDENGRSTEEIAYYLEI